jgi:hypothetical protein
MSALTTPTWSNTREKKKKRNKLKESSTSDRKPRKGEEQDHLKKTSLGPLRQGQRLDPSETKPCSNKERKPLNQSSNTTKSSPCTYASSLWAKAHSPEPMQQRNTRMKQRAKIFSPSPGRLDRLQRAVRPPAPQLTAWGWLDRPKRPTLHQTTQNFPEPIWTPSKHSQVPKACTNFYPLLTIHESRQKAKSFNI